MVRPPKLPPRAVGVLVVGGAIGACVRVAAPEHALAVPGRLGPAERTQVRRAERLLAGEGRDPPVHGAVAAARAVASGAFELGPRAEAALAGVLADADLDGTARYLGHVYGRLLNARASVLDLSRAGEQEALYRRLAAAAPGARERFVYGALADLAGALGTLAEGRRLAAYAEVRRIETRLRRYLRDHPDDGDVRTLYANHLLTVAAFVPVGRRRRVRRVADVLARQQRGWSELSPRARNERVAPGVRTVFAWWWAEAEAAAGRRDRARAAYAQVLETVGPGATVAQRQLGSLARARLAAGVPRRSIEDLRPLGRPACVACHARTTPIPGLPDPAEVTR